MQPIAACSTSSKEALVVTSLTGSKGQKIAKIEDLGANSDTIIARRIMASKHLSSRATTQCISQRSGPSRRYSNQQQPLKSWTYGNTACQVSSLATKLQNAPTHSRADESPIFSELNTAPADPLQRTNTEALLPILSPRYRLPLSHLSHSYRSAYNDHASTRPTAIHGHTIIDSSHTILMLCGLLLVLVWIKSQISVKKSFFHHVEWTLLLSYCQWLPGTLAGRNYPDMPHELLGIASAAYGLDDVRMWSSSSRPNPQMDFTAHSQAESSSTRNAQEGAAKYRVDKKAASKPSRKTKTKAQDLSKKRREIRYECPYHRHPVHRCQHRRGFRGFRTIAEMHAHVCKYHKACFCLKCWTPFHCARNYRDHQQACRWRSLPGTYQPQDFEHGWNVLPDIAQMSSFVDMVGTGRTNNDLQRWKDIFSIIFAPYTGPMPDPIWHEDNGEDEDAEHEDNEMYDEMHGRAQSMRYHPDDMQTDRSAMYQIMRHEYSASPHHSHQSHVTTDSSIDDDVVSWLQSQSQAPTSVSEQNFLDTFANTGVDPANLYRQSTTPSSRVESDQEDVRAMHQAQSYRSTASNHSRNVSRGNETWPRSGHNRSNAGEYIADAVDIPRLRLHSSTEDYDPNADNVLKHAMGGADVVQDMASFQRKLRLNVNVDSHSTLMVPEAERIKSFSAASSQTINAARLQELHGITPIYPKIDGFPDMPPPNSGAYNTAAQRDRLMQEQIRALNHWLQINYDEPVFPQNLSKMKNRMESHPEVLGLEIACRFLHRLTMLDALHASSPNNRMFDDDA